MEEHVIGSDGDTSSIPVGGSKRRGTQVVKGAVC